jgi:hypothetical protein
MNTLNFPMTPEELGSIAKKHGVEAGEPFPVGIDRSKGDGTTTCLMHRQWEWSNKFYAPLLPFCEICGGRCDPRLKAHELCAARKRNGVSTPKLDFWHCCYCSKCAGPNPKINEPVEVKGA